MINFCRELNNHYKLMKEAESYRESSDNSVIVVEKYKRYIKVLEIGLIPLLLAIMISFLPNIFKKDNDFFLFSLLVFFSIIYILVSITVSRKDDENIFNNLTYIFLFTLMPIYFLLNFHNDFHDILEKLYFIMYFEFFLILNLVFFTFIRDYSYFEWITLLIPITLIIIMFATYIIKKSDFYNAVSFSLMFNLFLIVIFLSIDKMLFIKYRLDPVTGLNQINSNELDGTQF